MHWDNGWHDGMGGLGWLVMVLVMVPFWVGVVWVVTNAVRNGGLNRDSVPSSPPVLATGPEGPLSIPSRQSALDPLRTSAMASELLTEGSGIARFQEC